MSQESNLKCVHCDAEKNVREIWFQGSDRKWSKPMCQSCIDSWLGMCKDVCDEVDKKLTL